MKRLLILTVICLFCFTGCSTVGSTEKDVIKNTPTSDTEMVGVWVTYSEMATLFLSGGIEKNFEELAKKCSEFGINNLYVHIRPFCDSVYKSQYFPQSSFAINYESDALEYMVATAHKHGLKLHAWINPYRVSTASNDINTLPEESPAKVWLSDDTEENDKNVLFTDNGIYLNPAENDVKKLILLGIREIIENYKVDGIHLDDYFYPTDDENFDKLSYDSYLQTTEKPLELADWRRQNVSSLIHTLYCAVKAHDKNILFGVSPAADIDRCYNKLFADVEAWAHGGYVDYIMPQLYFGFEYPIDKFKFNNLLLYWSALLEDTNAKFYIGLANYKIGTENEPDKAEWNEKDDIIARQIKLLRQEKADGFVFFSYSSLFSSNELNIKQTEKINELINKEQK